MLSIEQLSQKTAELQKLLMGHVKGVLKCRCIGPPAQVGYKTWDRVGRKTAQVIPCAALLDSTLRTIVRLDFLPAVKDTAN